VILNITGQTTMRRCSFLTRRDEHAHIYEIRRITKVVLLKR